MVDRVWVEHTVLVAAELQSADVTNLSTYPNKNKLIMFIQGH